MANLYGVANPLPLPVSASIIGGSNLACPAGVETNIIALTFNQPISQGWYYPVVSANLYFTLGATPSTSLNFGARIGAGSDFASGAIAQTLLVANATINFSEMFIGFNVALAYPTGALTINVTATPAAQTATAVFGNSLAYGWWARAPDQ